jgi:hypothetical protein
MYNCIMPHLCALTESLYERQTSHNLFISGITYGSRAVISTRTAVEAGRRNADLRIMAVARLNLRSTF